MNKIQSGERLAFQLGEKVTLHLYEQAKSQLADSKFNSESQLYLQLYQQLWMLESQLYQQLWSQIILALNAND